MLFHILTLLLATATNQVASICFDVPGATTGNCTLFVDDFCNNLGGIINSGNIETRCYVHPGYKCDLSVVANQGTSGVPSKKDCLNSLRPISHTCPEGGFETVNELTYYVDANSGVCHLTGD